MHSSSKETLFRGARTGLARTERTILGADAEELVQLDGNLGQTVTGDSF